MYPWGVKKPRFRKLEQLPQIPTAGSKRLDHRINVLAYARILPVNRKKEAIKRFLKFKNSEKNTTYYPIDTKSADCFRYWDVVFMIIFWLRNTKNWIFVGF